MYSLYWLVIVPIYLLLNGCLSQALSFFSSLTIYGLASSTTSGQIQSLTLFRNQSFPPKRFQWEDRADCPLETNTEWESLLVPVGKAHAELELLERLNEGRISIVYTARLLCVRQCPDGNLLEPDQMPGPLPDQFCVKLAKAEFIRSLARESWFYEQLAKEDGYQGVITPCCFGFFTVSLSKTLEISAWSKIECIPHKRDHEVVYDRYYDDTEEDTGSFVSDQRTCRENCTWNLERWISRADSRPIVGVLITERLGEHFPRDHRPGHHSLSEEAQQEIIDILDDLSAVGIMHNDVKFNNFLRPIRSSSPSPSGSSPSSLTCGSLLQICPRHNRVHPWRVIDFDRSLKWGKSVPVDMKYFTKVQRVDFGEELLWGEQF